ncbi:MAG: hypothetical protein JXQ90_19605 [Cyclobacteriaceae bacterium]
MAILFLECNDDEPMPEPTPSSPLAQVSINIPHDHLWGEREYSLQLT